MRRWLLRFLVLIFLVALLGCQKRFRIVPPSAQENGINKYAHIIIDVCDPTKHSGWLEPKSESERQVRFFCAVGMKKMEEKLEKIQNEKLKKLILNYKESKFR
ncbi:MAG: hypothetical protein AAB672_02660 [Patescibacteria group bacterium]